MECLKSELDIFLKRSIGTSVVNSRTVTYKPIAPRDNPAHLEFNCSRRSDYYIDLNSKTQIKTFTLSCEAQQVSNYNAFLGPIPESILIAFVKKNTAFVRSACTNPFLF